MARARIVAKEGVRRAKAGEEGEARAVVAKRLRPIVVVDEAGDPVRYVDHGQLLQGLLVRADVALEVEGKRPLFVKCFDCGIPVRVPRMGTMPKRCRPHQQRYHRFWKTQWARKQPKKVRDSELERERKRRWREKHAEKERETRRKRDGSDPEKLKESRRRWRENERKRKSGAK